MITRFDFSLIVNEPEPTPGQDLFTVAFLVQLLRDTGYSVEVVENHLQHPLVTLMVTRRPLCASEDPAPDRKIPFDEFRGKADIATPITTPCRIKLYRPYCEDELDDDEPFDSDHFDLDCHDPDLGAPIWDDESETLQLSDAQVEYVLCLQAIGYGPEELAKMFCGRYQIKLHFATTLEDLKELGQQLIDKANEV